MAFKKKVKTENKKSIFPIILGFIISTVSFLGLVKLSDKMTNPNGKSDVIVAVKNLDHGTVISKDNIDSLFKMEKSIDKSVVPDNSVKNLQELEGKIVNSTISKNEIMTQKDIMSMNNVLANIKHPREVSIQLNNIGDGVGGSLREGDLVDIVIKDDDAKASTEVLKRVYVSKALTANGSKIERGDKTAAEILTVIIDSNDVIQLESAKQKGKLTITKIK